MTPRSRTLAWLRSLGTTRQWLEDLAAGVLMILLVIGLIVLSAVLAEHFQAWKALGGIEP